MSQTYRVDKLTFLDLASYSKTSNNEIEDKTMIYKAHQYLDQPDRLLGPMIMELLPNGCFLIRSVCLETPDEARGFQVAIETAPLFDDWKTSCSCEVPGKCCHVLANLIFIQKSGELIYLCCACESSCHLYANHEEIILAQDIMNQREYYNKAFQDLYPEYYCVS